MCAIIKVIAQELVLCLKQHQMDIISSLMVCLSHVEYYWEEVDVQQSGNTQESIGAEKQNRPWKGYYVQILEKRNALCDKMVPSLQDMK